MKARRNGTRAAWAGALGGLLMLGACVATGGGGGGDCRDADDACAAGFSCVAVANGTAYACRASCDGAEDCLRDEVCGADGVCVDRPSPVDADEDAEVLETPAPLDLGVVEDAEPIRIVDATPDAAPPVDSDVVVVMPPDRGPDPGGCVEPAAPAADMLLGVEIRGFEGFPIHFEAHGIAEAGAVALTFEALSTAARRPTGVVTRSPPFVVEAGEFETPIVELRVPPSANQLGGELLLRVRLLGTVRGDGTVCGVLEGEMVEPPVGDISGSPFAGRATADLDGDPWPACAGCLP